MCFCIKGIKMFSFLLATYFTFFLAISISLLYFFFHFYFSFAASNRANIECWVPRRGKTAAKQKNVDGVNQLLNLTHSLSCSQAHTWSLCGRLQKSSEIGTLSGLFTASPHWAPPLHSFQKSSRTLSDDADCPATATATTDGATTFASVDSQVYWRVCVCVCIKKSKAKVLLLLLLLLHFIVCISGHWWTHRNSVKHGQVIYREVRGRSDSAFGFVNLKSDITWISLRLFSKRLFLFFNYYSFLV